jgi:Cu-processing system ATP-binding protein
MISIKKVSKHFGKLKALDKVSIDLCRGNSYALIGPNSSGKTTLIKSVLGMVVPSSGEILVGGKAIKRQWDYRKDIGYMPQTGRYPENMRIGQLFDMMKNIRKTFDCLDEDLLHAFGLEQMFDKRLHTLSGGTRQKVSAALAFLFDPSILILDEPTAGLDPVAVEVLKEKIIEQRNKQKLVLITSHIMSDLDELSSHVIYLFEGSVRHDSSLDALKDITGQDRLGRAIAKLNASKTLESQFK